MGKLTVKVHKCQLYRPAINGSCSINPRVNVVVDGTYRFQTRVKKDTFMPSYGDSFVVGNTHRLAVVELSVYDVQEPQGLVLPGIGVITASRGVVRVQTTTGGGDIEEDESGSLMQPGGGIGGNRSTANGNTPPVLLGRCYVALQRLVHDEPKRRTFSLGTPLNALATVAPEGSSPSMSQSHVSTAPPRFADAQVGPSLLQQSLPPGIAGTITISLESDSLGEAPEYFAIDEKTEALNVRRLRRFLLCHDKPKIQILDVLMAHVRHEAEMVRRNTSLGNTATDRYSARRRSGTTMAAPPIPTPHRGSVNNSLSSFPGQRPLSPDARVDDATAASASGTRQCAQLPHVLRTGQTNAEGLQGESGENNADEAHEQQSQSFSPRPFSLNFLTTRQVCLGGRPELTAVVPEECESFDELMARLCAHYRTAEPDNYRVVMRVDGFTNLDKDHWNQSLLGSDDVFAVFRSEAEQFATEMTSLQNTVVWRESNTVTLDVVDPQEFYVMVILMGHGAGKTYEIGRCCVSAATLSNGFISTRNMFICVGEGVTRMAANGVAHLVMRPVNFGITPIDLAKTVDAFYERLGRLFQRYDQLRLPEVDVLAKARLHASEEYMQELAIEYGREPGSARLLINIESLVSLRESAERDMNDQEVRLLISMGSSTVRTKSYSVRRFAPMKVRENCVFDVVRETDLIRIEVVNARHEDVIYGRVDFSCLNTQRGVTNKRALYLVGEAGTEDAYFSGIVRLNLYSDEVGHEYEVDIGQENTFTGRLRRYVHRRVPENLHRVNLAVATVFDMESFMAQLGLDYGEEDPTYALYFTVVGCRNLPSRIGGVNPYVVVRVGINAYQTKTAKSTVEPDYFEFCEFYYDRPGDMVITLVVMDQSDIGNDEEIGRASIPLADVLASRQYNDWLPLLFEKRNGKVKEVGSIGFKYTVVDLDLVDKNRLRLLKRYASRKSAIAPVVMEGGREQRQPNLGPSGDGGRADVNGPRQLLSPTPGTGSTRWTNFKRHLQQLPLPSHTMRAISTGNAWGTDEGDFLSSTDEANTHLVADSEVRSYHSMHSRLSRDPTMNLMDGGIHSVEEFFSGNDSLLSSAMHSDTEVETNGSFDLAMPELPDAHPSLQHSGDTNEVQPGNDRMQLRVRLLSCTNLLKLSNAAPSPYVLLSTIHETHRSRMQFDTTEPRFNETFRFKVENPNVDFLTITVLSDTPYGPKKLGHCILSMRNVQRGAMRTRWTSLVIHSFKPSAVECGAIYLSLGAINFGMNYLPSMDAENRLREQIREYLGRQARQQLHRLEWYVGEFSQLESVLLGGWLRDTNTDEMSTGTVGSRIARRGRLGGSNAEGRPQVADIELSIYGISHLYLNGFLTEGSVVVKARVEGHTRGKTRPQTGRQGSFVFPEDQEPLCFSVEDPAMTLVKISVILNGKTASGDCFVSLVDLHRRVTKARTLMLVMDSRSSHAEAIGVISLGVFCANYGSSAPAPTEEDLALHARLTRMCYFYLPRALATVDVKYATTLNVAAFLSRMVEKYGPEPGEFHLRVTVDRLYNMRYRRDDSRLHAFCIVRIGLQEFQSSIVEGESECVFCESFQLVSGLPSMEKVELIIMRYYPSKMVEIGRTAIMLHSLQKQEENALEVALVDNAGTKAASVCGTLKVSVYPENFGREGSSHLRAQSTFDFGIDGPMGVGHSPHPLMTSHSMVSYDNSNLLVHNQRHSSQRVQGQESRSLASGLLTGTSGAWEASDTEGDATRRSNSRHQVLPMPHHRAASEQRASAGTAATDGHNSTSAYVTVLGFDGLVMRDSEVHLRICERDGQALLKIKAIPVEQLVSLDPETSTFTVENVAARYDGVYTLKMGLRKMLGSETLCHADFCLTRCRVGRTVEKRLRLYDDNKQFLGICRLSVTMPDMQLPQQQWRYLPPNVFEPLMDDVASQLAIYTPKDLRRLDTILSRSPDIRTLHRSLRLQLAPSVVATVYLAIHKVEFRTATLRHTCVVTANVGNFTGEAERQRVDRTAVYPYGMSKEWVTKLEYPLIRVDISETGPAARLTLCVCDRASRSKSIELGRTIVSLRALLTPAVYTMSEKVQVPLVSIRHASNRVHATLIGTVSFSILPPSFESYSSAVRFSSSVVAGFSQEYVRYYVNRIWRLLSHYDANALVDIHARLYESYVSNNTWENGLPSYLADMVARWGPEVEDCGPPPSLLREVTAPSPLNVQEPNVSA